MKTKEQKQKDLEALAPAGFGVASAGDARSDRA